MLKLDLGGYKVNVIEKSGELERKKLTSSIGIPWVYVVCTMSISRFVCDAVDLVAYTLACKICNMFGS